MHTYLDPADSATSGVLEVQGPIPRAVRAFGRLPDMETWHPGDLLLFSAVEPPYISRRIVAAQELGGFAERDARWHHAAVYIGGGRLCEARWNGVRTTSIYDYIGTHRIRVRRAPS